MNPFKWFTQIRLSWSWCYPSPSTPLDVDPGPGTPSSPSFNSSLNDPYNRGDPNLKFVNVTSVKSFCEVACLLPRQVYHNFLLLRLPRLYSSRIAGLEWNSQGGGRSGVGVDSASGTPFHGGPEEWVYPPGSSGHKGTPGVSGAATSGFVFSEAFIDSLLREWKTLNVVSALLTSCVSFPLFFPPFKYNGALKKRRGILALLQIPEAADNPITRNTALLSLICALMSLSYGCIYIMRFGTMSMYRFSMWDEVRCCVQE